MHIYSSLNRLPGSSSELTSSRRMSLPSRPVIGSSPTDSNSVNPPPVGGVPVTTALTAIIIVSSVSRAGCSPNVSRNRPLGLRQFLSLSFSLFFEWLQMRELDQRVYGSLVIVKWWSKVFPFYRDELPCGGGEAGWLVRRKNELFWCTIFFYYVRSMPISFFFLFWLISEIFLNF